ncbi:hypothetical protein [Sandarakinorhabdus sp. DWP1-3-1]|uniref:hypothetical protein n=1 Tax=Sandarakinorhabdus sp. DWP1-3-1 TaxID=2804627 RepID=UPI003CE9134A
MIRAADSSGPYAPIAAPAATRALPGLGARALIVLLATMLAAPTLAAQSTGKSVGKPEKRRFSFETPLTPFQPPVTDVSRFSFTASGTSAATARMQTVERAFRFTPSGQSDNRKALSLGVATRVAAASSDHSRAAPTADAIAALPTAYSVDVSLAWKGFAVNSGYSAIQPSPTALLSGGRREAVDVGVSYRGANWKTSLMGTAEQGSMLMFAPLERRYSVELGGAYLVRPRLSVTGGVRYKLAPVAPSLLDPDRADQSVYLGTNIAF